MQEPTPKAGGRVVEHRRTLRQNDMFTLQRGLFAFLVVLALAYMLKPVDSYQAEIAKRKQVAPLEADQSHDDELRKSKQALEDRLRAEEEERARLEAERVAKIEAERVDRIEAEKAAQILADQQKPAAAARAEAERQQKAQLEAQNQDPETLKRMEATRERLKALRQSSPPVLRMNPATGVPMRVYENAPTIATTQSATGTASSQARSRAKAFQPAVQIAAPVRSEVVVKTLFKTRHLYLKLKTSTLKFDVSKSLSEPQLDALTKVLGTMCLAPQGTENRCRKAIQVDRSFSAAVKARSDARSSGGGWSLECVGELQDCTDSSKTAKLVLTSVPRAGTKTLALGFQVQGLGRNPASKSKAASEDVFAIEKVYVTRNMK